MVDRYGTAQTKLDNLNVELKNILKKSILQEAIQGKLVPQIVEEGTAQELHEQIKQEKQKLVKEGKVKKSALTDSVIFKGDDNKYYRKFNSSKLGVQYSVIYIIGVLSRQLSNLSNLLEVSLKSLKVFPNPAGTCCKRNY